MSIIISDTVPLRYLIEIEKAHILEELFGSIIIPEKVVDELQRPKTPQKVKDWMQARPDWLEVRKADLSLYTPQKKIGDGEREAFALAVELKAAAVLLDDDYAEGEARRLNVPTIRLFAILDRAAEQNLIDLPSTVDEMKKTSFRLPPQDIIDAMLGRDRQRKLTEEQKKEVHEESEEHEQNQPRDYSK
jgi:predicted nucleic acid-binding protein